MDLDEAIRPHIARADRFIAARLADARSHAKVGQIATAAQRLADLQFGLLGPDGSGLIGDSRAAFYRHAHHADYDPDLHDPARRLPVAEGARAARTAPIGGVDSPRELALLIDRARSGPVLAHATGRPEAFDTWHGQHATALRAWARRRISDDQISITAAVNWLRQKPEFRDET